MSDKTVRFEEGTLSTEEGSTEFKTELYENCSLNSLLSFFQKFKKYSKN